MNQNLLSRVLEFLQRKMWNKRWQRAVTCLGAVAVFGVTYALLLPAITMTKGYPTLEAEVTEAWTGEGLAVKVTAEPYTGDAEKVIVLTLEGEGADLSESYAFNEEGICVITDDAGREIELHRSIREDDAKTSHGRDVSRISYWFLQAAGEETVFTLDLIDKVDESRFAATVEAVKQGGEENAETVETASASNAGKAAAAAAKTENNATASNAVKASTSDAEVFPVTTENDFVELADGNVVNDLEGEEDEDDEQTETVADLKLSAGIGEDYEAAVKDAAMNAGKRGDAEVRFVWHDVIAKKAASAKLMSVVNGATIAVFYDKSAGIPEDAELAVYEIEEDSEEYKEYLAQTKSAMANATASDASKAVSSARFFDITILDRDGTEIHPDTPVKVVISYDEGLEVAEDSGLNVVHFTEDEPEVFAPVKVENGQDVNGLAFTAESFSVYGIIETGKLTETFLTADGRTVTVNVSYDESANIPDDAVLTVKEYKEGDEGWFARSLRLADVLYEKYGVVLISDARLMSISISADGQEIKPAAPVKVDINYSDVLNTEKLILENGTYDIPGGTQFLTIHYDGEKAEFIESSNTRGNAGISETSFITDDISDYDIVNFVKYENPKDEDIPNLITRSTAKVSPSDRSESGSSLSSAPVALSSSPRAKMKLMARTAGSAPDHNKTLDINGASTVHPLGDGTYKLGLDVTGESIIEASYPSINVLVIYDVSSSMSHIYYVQHPTGRYWLPKNVAQTSDNAIWDAGMTLFKLNDAGDGYVMLGDDEYTGDVYMRSGTAPNYEYTKAGTDDIRRFAQIRRAGPGEKAVHDFVEDLFEYQNPNDDPLTPQNERENIQVAIETFNATAKIFKGWSSDKDSLLSLFSSDGQHYHGGDGNTETLDHNGGYYGTGTNWEAAFRRADWYLSGAGSANTDDDPTYVLFVTDGEPTNRHNNDTSTDPNDGQTRQTGAGVPTNYAHSKDEALRVQNFVAESNGNLYSIYAYGDEYDYLTPLMEYLQGNADNFYRAEEAADLEAAFTAIFQKIVDAAGIRDVAIDDGTTHVVPSATQADINYDLLEVDDSSFEYWLNIEVDANNKFKLKDPVTADEIEYTVTPSGNNVTISWTDRDGAAKTATYEGSVSDGKLVLKWTAETPFYEAPPAATYTESTGKVFWNLNTLGTLLNGVVYRVTFDCYPSQYTFDTIAQLQNGDITYGSLDANVQNYLLQAQGGGYTLRTNTEALLYYNDTRTEEDEQPSPYDNPDPVPTNVNQMTITKDWFGDVPDVTSLPITVMMSGSPAQVFHTATLTEGNNWTTTAYISVGIIKNGQALAGAKGHDFYFAELDGTQYHWELDAPTVRPMLINNEVVALVKVDAKHPAPDGATTYEIDGATYYVNDFSGGLLATNIRRPYLDIKKEVIGNNAPADAEFDFTIKVVNSHASSGSADDTASDYYVWFAVKDTNDTTGSPTGTYVIDDNLVTGTNVMRERKNGNYTGYYYAPSGTEIHVNMKHGYRIRFTNLPSDSTYEVTESATLPDSFSFVNIAGDGTVDPDNDHKISGTIQLPDKDDPNPKTEYIVTVTNKYETIDVLLKKVDDKQQLLSGATFDLFKQQGETWVKIQENIKPGDAATGTANPFDLGRLGIGTYKLTETGTPDGYIKLTEGIVFEVYEDGTVLKARLAQGTTDAEIDGPGTGDIPTYTITAKNTPGQALPATGGPGTALYTLSGMILLIGSALLYGFRRRHEERRSA